MGIDVRSSCTTSVGSAGSSTGWVVADGAVSTGASDVAGAVSAAVVGGVVEAVGTGGTVASVGVAVADSSSAESGPIGEAVWTRTAESSEHAAMTTLRATRPAVTRMRLATRPILR
jgi:hypothetical protein